MIEVVGNLWAYPADVRVITTNGTVKKNGECVMGRGCAAEAKQLYPELAKLLGDYLRNIGNVPHYLRRIGVVELYSFPVKHNWHEKADIRLITRSAQLLVDRLVYHKRYTIVLPRPGCGNGGLKWEDVKPVLEPILDDRFHVITFK